MSKTLYKGSNNISYNNNKGKRQKLARNLIYNSLMQNNNNKIMNIIIPKYKNTLNIMKETKNSVNFSKYTPKDNENTINNNENDSAYKNTDRSNISYRTDIKNEFAHKTINEKVFKDGILKRKIKNFNINSNNYDNNMNISQKLSTTIPMNKLGDKLKNKHIKIIIRKKSINQLRKKNFNINFNESNNKSQKEIINNFEKNNGENEIKTSIKGKDSINKIVTNLYEPIKLKNDKYFSNLMKINNTNYNSYYKNEKNKITNNGNLSQNRYYHKRSIKNKILKLDINNNINFTLNNNLKNIINICNSEGSIKLPYKNEKITKYDNEQIKKYDSNTNIYLTIPLKYEKIPKNNLSNNKIKEIKKTIYSPYNQIKNQSLNRFIYNNEKINQLNNKRLQNNSKVINSSKKTKINSSNFLNNQNKFNKNIINTEFN